MSNTKPYDMPAKSYEFAMSAGPGRLMNYGVASNRHTAQAAENLARMKSAAIYGEDLVKSDIRVAPEGCVTGQ